MDLGLTGRACVVTGASRGIGLATARALAREGGRVLLVARSEDALAEAARACAADGGEAAALALDVTSADAGERALAAAEEHFGGVDVLVNNAARGDSARFLELGWDDWRETMAVDLDGPFLCSQRAARRMVEQGHGGRIVNVTSVHEHVPSPGAAAYTSAKHGLGGLTKQMALDLAEYEITVNAVAPGEIATPMTGNEDVDPRTIKRDSIPAGRPGDAREIASLIVWLSSDAAAYATGASFVVDGGLTLTAAVRDDRS
jgi:NAD(P)-dependent dehydrogenase (short-subunit alcohol dehydrogenase family)